MTLKLDTANRSLEGVLDGGTTLVKFTVGYKDKLAQGVQPERGGTQIASSNGSTDVTICDAPQQNVTREIDYICAYNGEANARVITIQIDDSGTNYKQWELSVSSSDTVIWTVCGGFQQIG